MTSDVIALCASGTTILPLACEAKIICAFAADVIVTEVVVEGLWVAEVLAAGEPKTPEGGRADGRRKPRVVVVASRRRRGSMKRVSG